MATNTTLPTTTSNGGGGSLLNRRMNQMVQALIATTILLVLVPISLFLSGNLFNLEQIKSSPYSPSHDDLLANVQVPLLEEAAPTPKTAPSSPFTSFPYFLPGSLTAMNRTETMHLCHVPRYYTQRLPTPQGCSRSDKNKIIFHLTPKSGSSTGRHVIKYEFGGVDYSHDSDCQPPSGETGWTVMTVLRNPATRAFASYEEMFVRLLGRLESIPANCRAFMEPFRGMTYKNYSALFDTEEGVAKLNLAYERFMRDWDGRPFELHLDNQVGNNMRKYVEKDGRIRVDASHLDMVLDTHQMEHSFIELAKRVRLNKVPEVIRGRSYPRRLNVSRVSPAAYQAMCRAYKEDFCCLNYVLPPACLRADMADQTRVRCRWNGQGKIEAIVV